MDDMLLFWVTFVLYAILISGIGILFYPYIRERQMKLKMRYRLVARRKELEGPGKLIAYLNNLTGIAFRGRIGGKTFLVITLSIFFLVSIVGIRNFQPGKTIFATLCMSALPYLLARIRIETIRRKSSFEGEVLISNFLSQYRICGFNIFETLEHAVINYKETKVSNRLLTRLMMELRVTSNPESIEGACERFSYGIHTNWGRMLAYNIGLAAGTGCNVSGALEDILVQLREARTLVEERKRLNAEAVRMTVYLIPFLYLGTILLSVYFMGISYREFLENQFFSEEGFSLFLTMGFMMLVNIVLIESINNQRFDF